MLVFYLSLLETESDKVRFTQIYVAYEKKMYYVALQILNSREKAEDATHDAFIKVIKHFETCKAISEEDLPKWLITIAKHAALDIIKKENHTISIEDESLISFSYSNDTPTDFVSFDDIVSKIKALPEIYREILELKLVLEWSDKEIAQKLQLNPNTARSRIMRGKELLRETINQT